MLMLPVAGLLLPRLASATVLPAVATYRDPGCGCCEKWVEHLRAAGFSVTIADDPDRATRRSALGIGEDLAGCHTAIIGGYAVEGHVPVRDILRLLDERTGGAIGLAVPGMPIGSPGMEYENQLDRYDVLLLLEGGRTEIFASYPAG
jgi:hypothetical protein